ncbi:MAG: DUF1801 domain-containing protein [Pedobacter sp.]|nr:MAG: DUF1801 domain-containing protein [Pedobacter sp.]
MNQVELYISTFETQTQEKLNQIRNLFFELLPDIKESISYNMPSYTNEKYTLYFASYKNHIGFDPIGKGSKLEKELAPFRAKNTKDTLHFMHNKPLPINLIKQIILNHL